METVAALAVLLCKVNVEPCKVNEPIPKVVPPVDCNIIGADETMLRLCPDPTRSPIGRVVEPL